MDTISGTLRILQHDAYVLFDTGASFSSVSESFVDVCGMHVEIIPICLYVNTPIGSGVMLNKICRGVDIVMNDKMLPADLVVMSIEAYDELISNCQIDKAIFEADKEFEENGVLIDANDILPKLRKKYLG